MDASKFDCTKEQTALGLDILKCVKMDADSMFGMQFQCPRTPRSAPTGPSACRRHSVMPSRRAPRTPPPAPSTLTSLSRLTASCRARSSARPRHHRRGGGCPS